MSTFKTAGFCNDLTRVVVAAEAVGVPLPPLAFQPIRGENQIQQRTTGWQRLHFLVTPGVTTPTNVSIRTVHDCGGRESGRTMLTVSVPRP